MISDLARQKMLRALEENAILREEVRVSRRASEITAKLVVEQFAKIDEMMLRLVEKADSEKELREKLTEKLREVELREADLARDQKRLEEIQVASINMMEDLALAREAAEEASRAKSGFLANMSHEIRTPLNGVMGIISLLLESDLTSEQREYANTAFASGEILLTVINDILDLSKIEARKLDLEICDFDLHTTLEEISDVMAIRAHEKGLEFACFIDPQVPVRLRGDSVRIRQVLTNLINNAIKFTEQGAVTVRVNQIKRTSDSARIKIAVEDTGIGIPKDKLGTLFDPFTQADVSTTRKFGGTGLGLTISSRLIELMGGTIGFESEEDEGSTFWIEVSFTLQSDADQSYLTVPDRVRDARILVVDSNPTSREYLSSLLLKFGCRPECVSCGALARDKLRDAAHQADPFAIAILNMHKAEDDAIRLARTIKEDDALRAMSLVLMKTLGRRGVSRKVDAQYFSAYLTSPVKQSQLCDCLVEIVTGDQDSMAPSTPVPTEDSAKEMESPKAGRILLAEDNVVNQKVALKVLQKLGYSPDIASNGLEALEAVEKTAYDLILMDCNMPKMDGYEAATEIRRREAGERHVPIIALTANAMKGDREICLEAGMDDHITKPISVKSLREAVAKWIAASG